MKTICTIVTSISIACGVCSAATAAKPPAASEVESTQPAPSSVSKQGQNVFDRAQCFDKVWKIVSEGFWDPNFNGVDWEDAGRRYRPEALAAKDHESFAVIINEMLGELKTSHTRYFTKWDPGYYTLQVVFGKPDAHRNGIGVVTKKIKGHHYVIAVLASSSAEKAGIVLGDMLIEVDGRPFHPIRSFENKAGQELEITVQRGPAESTGRKLKVTPVDMKEEDRLGNDSHASLKTIEYKGHRFAYVRLWWLRGLQMKHVLEYGIYRANEAEGIIIDIRDGFGGDMGYEYIAPFLQYGLGETTVESIERQRTLKSVVGCNKPVVVLINGGSRSGKETLAYLFKKTGRGILVGEITAGFVTGGRNKAISSDSFLYYGSCKIVIDGKCLEGVGVEPDIEVPFDIRFAAGRDIQLERAKDEMVKLIEAGQSTLSTYSPREIYAPAAQPQWQSKKGSAKKAKLDADLETSTEKTFDRAQCFDKVWETINEEFWDPKFNGVDWEDADKRYKPKALAAKDHESFAVVINEMLAELKTSHTRYYTKWDVDYYSLAVVSGKRDSHRNGIGVVTRNIDGCHYVIAVLKSSSAEEAGIVLGDWLVAVDGQPFHPIRSFENKAGQELEMTVQRGPLESTRQRLKVTPLNKDERDWFGHDSHTSLRTIEHKGHRFAYARLWWLRGRTMKQVLEYGIKRANKTEGIIIDIRDGSGGDMGYQWIAPFLKDGLPETTVEYRLRGRCLKGLRTYPSIAACNKPVIVLINGNSHSGKEVLAYFFKKTGRGVLVGERTPGYVAGGRKKDISPHSFLYYCAFMVAINGKRLEGVGVEPDIVVPFDIRFAAGRDIQLERAKEEMVKLIEAGQNTLATYSPLDKNAPASLGSLRTRDRIIRLEMGARISILDSSRQPIALFLNETRFQSEFPEFYEAFKNLLAIGQSKDLILDASINKP